MAYRAILLDVDGTMIDSERVVTESLTAAMAEFGLPAPDDHLRQLAMYGTSEQVMRELKLSDPEAGLKCWNRHWVRMLSLACIFPRMEETLQTLHNKGILLGVVTSRTRYEYDTDTALRPLNSLFSVTMCVEDAARPKPYPDPILTALERLNLDAQDVLYIGDGPNDSASAHAAKADFALALWGARPDAKIDAEYRLAKPQELLNLI